jgi:hypothetical protein
VPQPQNIINQSGPLPISAEVQTGSVGPATLTVAGSVWSSTANTMIGVEVFLDGAAVGTSVIYSNGTEEHRTTVPVHIGIDLDKPFTGDPPTEPPVYTVELRPLNAQTNSDGNDVYQVTLIA